MAVTLTSGSRTVTLRNPDFGDTDVIESRRIQRKNRGGDLIMYRDPQWPKYETFTFEFSFLKRTDLLALIEFVKDFLGQEVTMVDYNGRSFVGIITTPSEELTQAGRENFTARFSFEVNL